MTYQPQDPNKLHSKHCLAEAVISAVQNWRDVPGFSDVDFRIWLQDGHALQQADDYLTTGLQSCICEQYRMAQYQSPVSHKR